MKKILITFLCIFLITGTLCPAVLADEPLKIVSGSILNGELDAEVSVLLKYEFSEEISEVSYEQVTVLPATVSELAVDGKILTIRLAAAMTYDTEHILDLSKVTSVSGKNLSDADSKIKFMTKHGEEQKIFEDDFETGVLSAYWRSASDVIVQKDGDGGNYSRKAAASVNFDNFIGSSSVYKLTGDFVIEFDILIDKDTIETDYATLSFAGNNGLSSNSPDYKRFETKRLLGYDVETGKFGVLFDTLDTSASIPSAPVAGKVLDEGWNNILVKINREAQTLNLYINGDLLENGSGESDFSIPCAGSTGYSPTMDDMPVINIAHRNIGASSQSGGADACIYYDNISYRSITAPIFAGSSVKEGEKIFVTCPEIRLTVRNFPSGAELSLDGTPIAEENIKKIGNNVLAIYPDLTWEQSYTLSGKVLGEFGSETEFSLSFETGAQPESLIETVGFFGAGDERLSQINEGTVTAKVKFWQKTDKSYILLAGLYKEVDGRIKMLSVSSPQSFTSEGTLEEKEVSIAVPADCENCFVELIILKDTLSRMPYESSLYSGSQVLK